MPTAPRPYPLAEVAAEPLLLNRRLGTYTNFVNLLPGVAQTPAVSTALECAEGITAHGGWRTYLAPRG